MDKHTHHDFKGLTDWVEIFKAGKQTDSKGRTQEFTQSDLDSVVANLDPARPPKHVITHSEMYSPFGYGDITELKREGDSLFAKSSNIEPQFDALVRNGRLPDRSVRLLPTDNGFKLGHLAWLGAEPPAVEGLAPVEFSASNEVLDFTLSNNWYTPNVLQRFMRRTREFLLGEYGKEKADEVIPEWEIEGITEHAIELRKEGEPSGSQFSKSPDDGGSEVTTYTQEQLDEAVRQAKEAEENARNKAASDFAAQQEQQAEELRKERQQRLLMEFSHEVAGLVDTNKLTPAMAAGAADFMASLASEDDAAFDFSVGDGDDKKDMKKTPLQWFRDFMASMPEHKLEKEVGGGGDGVDLEDANAIARRALEYQAAQDKVGITVSMSEAVAHVTKGDK